MHPQKMPELPGLRTLQTGSPEERRRRDLNPREGVTLNPLSRRAPSTGLGDASSDDPHAGDTTTAKTICSTGSAAKRVGHRRPDTLSGGGGTLGQ